MSSTAMGSTPANGSSSSMNFGSVASARAISTRRRSPPESASAGVRLRWVMENSASSSSSMASRFSRMGSTTSSTARMLFSTVSPRKMEASCGR